MNETNVTREPPLSDTPASQKRLREILQVLGKHHITHGLTPFKLREILEDLGPTLCKARTDHVHALGYASGKLLP